jgi:hypothetical protein
MRHALFPAVLLVALAGCAGATQPTGARPIRIFDGRTFRGWEGDTVATWRIEDGALVGGSPTVAVPRNSFLATTREFKNFDLHVKYKLVGTTGFVNGGVQFHSQRTTNPPNEMSGYQSDLGAGYWGSLYDESRRNRTLVMPDSIAVKKLVRMGDWNDMEVRTQNGHIQIFLNGVQTVDYTEPDASISQSGRIGLQVHGGGITQVYYKDLILRELP